MPTPTREDVGKIARSLITLNGETTTLEVKLALRKIGFFATQDVIRNLMLDITSKDGDIQYEEQPHLGYRRYTFAGAVALNLGTQATFDADDDDDATGAKVTTVTTVTTVHRDKRPADYAVFDDMGRDRKFYRSVTRNQAKRNWEKSTGRPYFEARTKKYDPA